MGVDELKIFDLVAKRFLGVFFPEAVYERTRVETTVEERVFRTSGRVLLEAGWKSVYGEESRANGAGADDDSGAEISSYPLSPKANLSARSRSTRFRRRRSRQGGSATRRFLAQWKRRARISTRPSYARR